MNVYKDYKYTPAYLPPDTSEESSWALILIGKKILMCKADNKLTIPEHSEVLGIIPKDDSMLYIGRYDGHDCYCMRFNELPELPEYLELVEIMEITKLSGDNGLFILAGAANHILHWSSMNQYCGCCGNKTIDKKEERAKVCTVCGNIVYPRIAPATITAIFHEDKILLAHNRNFRNDLYSLIAGFVEPGETLEQCVEREVLEEVGIKVKNIRYFNSQPWSFPDSLMIAFIAEYESGEIRVDNTEIMDAAWFTADILPEIPSNDSIAGKIIRWYREQYTK